MKKQLKATEDFDGIVEEDLKPVEVKIESLTKDELVKLCNEKDLELNHYRKVLDNLSAENKNILKNYNEDMNYLSTINSNIIKVIRKKEDAVKNIMLSTLELMTIDRDEIAPQREDETNGNSI